MKRIFGMTFVVLLLCSVCVLGIPVANNSYNNLAMQSSDNYAYYRVSSLSDSVVIQLTETHTDNQIDINVRLITNTGILGMTLELQYRKDIFEFKGYERGSALSNLDLISTDLSSDTTLPIRFNWFNNDSYNDFTQGTILKLHFTLKQNISRGGYEIGFKYNQGDITYIENGNANSKSAIISKAVVNVSENKISKTEIVEDSNDNSSSSWIWILGISLLVCSILVAAVLIVLKKRNAKGRKQNWLEI